MFFGEQTTVLCHCYGYSPQQATVMTVNLYADAVKKGVTFCQLGGVLRSLCVICCLRPVTCVICWSVCMHFVCFEHVTWPTKHRPDLNPIRSCSCSCVNVDGVMSNCFAVDSGVRQGCRIAPDLFLGPMDYVMERTVHRGMTGVTLEHEIFTDLDLSLIHIWRCRRIERCRSRWSPYH